MSKGNIAMRIFLAIKGSAEKNGNSELKKCT